MAEAEVSVTELMGCGGKEALDDSAVCLTGPAGHRPLLPPPPTPSVYRLSYIRLLFFSVYKAAVKQIQFPGELLVPRASLGPSIRLILAPLHSLRTSQDVHLEYKTANVD